MTAFFCTRCGSRLELDAHLAGRPVRCPQCTAVVRSPAPVDAIPTAMLADMSGIGLTYLPPITTESADIVRDDLPVDDVAIDDLADAVVSADIYRSDGPASSFQYDEFVSLNDDGLTLNYANPKAPRLYRGSGLPPAYVTDLANRLAAVESGDPKDEGSMTNCPYCGSTIAPYVGRCPFCRHPLK